MKNKYLLVFVSVIAIFFTILSYQPVKAVTGKKAIILMGQSNAQGMYSPLLEYLRDSGISLKVIPCMKGGMPVSYFIKGTDMYAKCMADTKNAIANGYTIDAIFFNQGEADATPGLYSLWRMKFVTLMFNFRADCNCQPLIIFAQLNIHPGKPDSSVPPAIIYYWNLLRKEQYQLSLDRPNFHMLSLESLPMLCPPHYCGQYPNMVKLFMSKYYSLKGETNAY